MNEQTLSVLQVNTVDVFGGAARVASDLHQSLVRRGIESWMAVGTKQGDDPRVVEIPNEAARNPWTRTLNRVARVLDPGTPRRGLGWGASRAALVAADPARMLRLARGYEDFGYPGTARLLALTPVRPSVLHLHNLHGFYFDIRQLPRLTGQVPALMTMHDAWPMTGHCAHPMACERWSNGCGSCPDLDAYVPIGADATWLNCGTKRRALAESRIALVTPSRWLMDMVECSGVAQRSLGTRVIPNGVDMSVFTPGDKAAARRELGLPAERAIALIAAQSLRKNPFKDFDTLNAALPLVAEHIGASLTLIALGHEGDPIVAGTADIVDVPFVNDPARVALYYQAADVYIHASKAENLPLAIIEAMACGTPVVASRVGGVPEIIVDAETGALVEPGNATTLALAVSAILNDAQKQRAFSEAGVKRAREHFGLDREVDAYLNLYEELLVHSSSLRSERPHL